MHFYLSCVEVKFINDGNIFTQWVCIYVFCTNLQTIACSLYRIISGKCDITMIQSKIHNNLENRRFLTNSTNNFNIAFELITDTISHSYIKYMMTFITLFYKSMLMLCVSRDLHSSENREIHYHFNRNTGGFTFLRYS